MKNVSGNTLKHHVCEHTWGPAGRALQGPSQRWDNKNVGLSFRDYRVREILKLRLPAASRLQEAASGWNTDCALDQEAAASRWGRFYAQALDSLRVKSARPGSCRVPTKIILAASLTDLIRDTKRGTVQLGFLKSATMLNDAFNIYDLSRPVPLSQHSILITTEQF